MIKIVLATKNKGKIKEIINKTKNIPFEFECLSNYPLIPDIKEDGHTFSENAQLKAKYVSEYTRLPALADDSGLEIDYLDKKPGIYSARWGNNDCERILNALQSLKNANNKQRKARFRCVMCLSLPGGDLYFTEGNCEGYIASSPKGKYGFGYDPIFIPEGYKRTFAQLGENIKNKISHRSIALEKMIELMISHFGLE